MTLYFLKAAQAYLRLSEADIVTTLEEVSYGEEKYRSRALGAVHKAMEDLHRAGLLYTKTMREFDASCLTPVENVSPRQIAAMRKRAGVSQAVFASYLNVTPGLISK